MSPLKFPLTKHLEQRLWITTGYLVYRSNMIALRISDTYMNYRRHNPKEIHRDIHSPGNLKCHVVCVSVCVCVCVSVCGAHFSARRRKTREKHWQLYRFSIAWVVDAWIGMDERQICNQWNVDAQFRREINLTFIIWSGLLMWNSEYNRNIRSEGGGRPPPPPITWSSAISMQWSVCYLVPYPDRLRCNCCYNTTAHLTVVNGAPGDKVRGNTHSISLPS
jgi:hypothetical protein